MTITTTFRPSRALWAIALICTLLIFPSCEDNEGEDNNTEFTQNWRERNSQYFLERMAEAKQAVSEAKAAYGDDWENHTSWRVVRSWAKVEGANVGITDSICYTIVEKGNGSNALPLYTDSVRCNYIGRLIPTTSYADGKVFDHSGLYEDADKVFSNDFSLPTKFAVSNLIEGYTTLLMHMHIGDRCRVYIPQELAYLSASSSNIPAYSTLVFDVQLKGIWRKGVSTGTWE